MLVITREFIDNENLSRMKYSDSDSATLKNSDEFCGFTNGKIKMFCINFKNASFLTQYHCIPLVQCFATFFGLIPAAHFNEIGQINKIPQLKILIQNTF